MQETGRPAREIPRLEKQLAIDIRQNAALDCRHSRDRAVLRQGCYGRLTRRKFRNFPRNRPETTNLNHQYAIRRVFICPVLDVGGPAGTMDSAEPGDRM